MPSVTVQYDPNGATGPSFVYTSIPAPQYFGTYTEGTPTSVTISGNTGSLVKTGFTFKGWNTQADGLGTNYGPNTPAPLDPTNITTYGGGANLLLYAKWV
jgi:uncharacterized repeat protein (TIGR02543 family)